MARHNRKAHIVRKEFIVDGVLSSKEWHLWYKGDKQQAVVVSWSSCTKKFHFYDATRYGLEEDRIDIGKDLELLGTMCLEAVAWGKTQ